MFLPGLNRPHQVVVVALDNVVAFELGLPARFFATDSLLPGWPTAPVGDRPYEVSMVTLDDRPVRTSAGYLATPTRPHTVLAEADTVVLCGMPDHPVMHTGTLTDQQNAALDLVPAGGRWISICTGAFVLAARGLLDGLVATTHWVHADRFREVFPQVELDPQRLYVDNSRVLTSAGNAAGIDLLLHVIRHDLGVGVANRVARGCVVAPMRAGGQSQFIDHPVRQADDASTAVLQRWILAHLDEPLPLDRLARQAHLSVRSLTRRFRDESGQTVGEWIAAARIDRAQHLLESTGDTVDTVARAVGFGTAAAFRSQFRASVGVSPAAYRRTFRADRSA